MGQQANATKERTCHSCTQQFYMTAQAMAEHAAVCVRAKQIGLSLPHIERPKVKLIKLGEQDEAAS